MRFSVISCLVSAIILSGCYTHNTTPKIEYSPSKEMIAPEISTGRNEKPVVSAEKFMAVSAHPLATKAGFDILKAGGTAIDAAIAIQMVLNVVEPQSSGIGGGGFLIHYDVNKNNIFAFDGRETAPSAVKSDIFLDKKHQPISFTKAAYGGHAVAVPGLLKMLETAHKKYGKLEWHTLFQPAIQLAENGFPLTERLYKMLDQASYYKKQSLNDYSRYLNNNNSLKNAGETIYNQPLAQTFKTIATNGSKVFYQGDIAKDIIQTVSDAEYPSVMTLNDLDNYQEKIRSVSCIRYHDNKVCGMPPPSSGGVAVMQSLKMLERFNFKDYDVYNPYDVHLTASAMRLAYADRSKYLADPDYVAVPTEQLLSETYLRQRSSLINSKRVMDVVMPGDPSEPVNQYASLKTQEPPSTTHMSIVDSYGNAVSFTSTIERAFGSGLATKSGFLLNNEMTDFDFVATKNDTPVLNSIGANKRPRSSMAPIFIFDKKNNLKGVIGSPGGARIIAYVLPKILYMLHTNKPLNEIVNTPNFTAMMPDSTMEVEAGLDIKELNSKLEKLSYTPYLSDLNSGIHAIQLKNNKIYGAADPRRDGEAMGE